MARISQPRRTETRPEDLEAYDEIVTRMVAMIGAEPDESGEAEVGEYWGALLNSPRMAAALSELGKQARAAGEEEGSYSHSDREFVDQVLWAEWKTNVVQAVHLPDALGTGVRLEAVEALRDGRDEDLTEDERLLATYIRQVVSGTLSEETFAAMVDRLGARGVTEYTIFILLLQLIIRMMQAIGHSEPSDAEIGAMIQGFKDGTIPMPNWRQRIN
jgi:hypothetical protein